MQSQHPQKSKLKDNVLHVRDEGAGASDMTSQMTLSRLPRSGLKTGRKLCSRFRVLNVFLILINLIAVYLLLSGGIQLPTPESYFASPVSPEQKIRLMNLVQTFDRLMTAANVSYFIAAGTLLGSYRHHSIIPWDDDVDVFVSEKDKERTDRVLTQLPKSMSHFVLFHGQISAPAWKFYDKNSPDWYYQHSFRWPFVDIFFYHQDETHIWHVELGNGGPYEKNQMFPLVRRPFGDLWLPGPCNATFALKYLDTNECQNRGFSHMVNIMLPAWRQRRIACERLKHMHPFVERKVEFYANGSSVSHEVLKIGNSVLRKLTLRLPKCQYTPLPKQRTPLRLR